jgi:hypothetical protein
MIRCAWSWPNMAPRDLHRRHVFIMLHERIFKNTSVLVCWEAPMYVHASDSLQVFRKCHMHVLVKWWHGHLRWNKQDPSTTTYIHGAMIHISPPMIQYSLLFSVTDEAGNRTYLLTDEAGYTLFRDRRGRNLHINPDWRGGINIVRDRWGRTSMLRMFLEYGAWLDVASIICWCGCN